MFKQIIFVGILVLPIFSSASVNSDRKLLLDCIVGQVVDKGSFENTNDFSFKKYRHVFVDADRTGNLHVHIGALQYESGSYDNKTITPIYNKSLLAGFAVASPEGERLDVVVNGGVGRGNTGALFWQSDKDEPYHRVANLKCR